MRIGVVTRKEDSWYGKSLRKAFEDRHQEASFFGFKDLVARIGHGPIVSLRHSDLIADFSVLFVRPIGRGSLDEVVFQLDLLHTLFQQGMPVVNTPASIEKAVDKYRTLELLRLAGIPVPKTVVTESVREALEAFRRFGGEAVIKPVFGSRGIGAARISDADIAERIFRTLRFYKHVIYVQEFIPHGNSDIRAFVIKDEVVAAMRRNAKSWKTNVSQGATPMSLDPSQELTRIVVDAAKAIGCEIAGVDVMESDQGYIINEVNSQPGWRGLQSTTNVDLAGSIADYLISKAR